MKKVHFVLLVVTAVTALFSAYSLAAMNQVYKIYFEWYSQYNNRYTNEYRDTSSDRWYLEEYPENMTLRVIASEDDMKLLQGNEKNRNFEIANADLNKYVYFFCSLGQTSYPEYRIKIQDIAQRGNILEVKVSTNSPMRLEGQTLPTKEDYIPVDVVRIDRSTFPPKENYSLYLKIKMEGRSENSSAMYIKAR